MILSRDYEGNDCSSWCNGIIHVGGAVGGLDAFRNMMVLRNGRYKLPIEVAVQNEDDSYLYIGMYYVCTKALLNLNSGTWYLKETRIRSWSETSDDPVLVFDLISRCNYLAQPNHLNPNEGKSKFRSLVKSVLKYCRYLPGSFLLALRGVRAGQPWR